MCSRYCLSNSIHLFSHKTNACPSLLYPKKYLYNHWKYIFMFTAVVRTSLYTVFLIMPYISGIKVFRRILGMRKIVHVQNKNIQNSNFSRIYDILIAEI